MIKPFSATKIKLAYQKASKALDKKQDTKGFPHSKFLSLT